MFCNTSPFSPSGDHAMTRKVTACQPLNPNGPPRAFRGCGRPGICLRPKCSLSHSSAAGGAGLSFFPFDIWPQRQQSFRARGVNVPDSQLRAAPHRASHWLLLRFPTRDTDVWSPLVRWEGVGKSRCCPLLRRFPRTPLRQQAERVPQG